MGLSPEKFPADVRSGTHRARHFVSRFMLVAAWLMLFGTK
jgi:hypothetical protein